MARYHIYCDGQNIGASSLEERDEPMRVASGRFFPSLSYGKVATVFALFADAHRDSRTGKIPDGGRADPSKLEKYYAARDSLRLELRTESGLVVSTKYIHIVDFSPEFGADSIEVEVVLDGAESLPRL